jgi:hypothetical protein
MELRKELSGLKDRRYILIKEITELKIQASAESWSQLNQEEILLELLNITKSLKNDLAIASGAKKIGSKTDAKFEAFINAPQLGLDEDPELEGLAALAFKC